jgi:hypothetical protein
MKRIPLLTLAPIGALGLGAFALADHASPARTFAAEPTADAAITSSETIARGAYLVKIMGCNDCHTPWTMTQRGPEPDMTRELSGHPQELAVNGAPAIAAPWAWAGAITNTAFGGPWGVSFTANLTPDPETGLGKWTPDTFISAIRNGRHEGVGRPLLPPMPWPMYKNATDQDLRAIFAYLQSIRPIKNRVPAPIEPPEAP